MSLVPTDGDGRIGAPEHHVGLDRRFPELALERVELLLGLGLGGLGSLLVPLGLGDGTLGFLDLALLGGHVGVEGREGGGDLGVVRLEGVDLSGLLRLLGPHRVPLVLEVLDARIALAGCAGGHRGNDEDDGENRRQGNESAIPSDGWRRGVGAGVLLQGSVSQSVNVRWRSP